MAVFRFLAKSIFQGGGKQSRPFYNRSTRFCNRPTSYQKLGISTYVVFFYFHYHTLREPSQETVWQRRGKGTNPPDSAMLCSYCANRALPPFNRVETDNKDDAQPHRLFSLLSRLDEASDFHSMMHSQQDHAPFALFAPCIGALGP